MVTPGSQVRAARLAVGLSIRQLAQRARVASSTVWRIETGRLDPTVGMLGRLLDAAAGSVATSSEWTREAAVSLTLGRLTAAQLLRDPPPVLDRARRRVAKMLADPDLAEGSRRWMLLWAKILEGPLEDVVAVLIDPGERGYELRQNTPFAGILSDEDRLDAVRRASREHRATRSA